MFFPAFTTGDTCFVATHWYGQRTRGEGSHANRVPRL
jgi:hypothetical protein